MLTEGRSSVNTLLPSSRTEVIRHQTEAAKHRSLYDRAQSSIHKHIRGVAKGDEKLDMDSMESWFKDSKHHKAMADYHNKMASIEKK